MAQYFSQLVLIMARFLMQLIDSEFVNSIIQSSLVKKKNLNLEFLLLGISFVLKYCSTMQCNEPTGHINSHESELGHALAKATPSALPTFNK